MDVEPRKLRMINPSALISSLHLPSLFTHTPKRTITTSYSAAGAIEGAYAIQHGQLIELSMQQVRSSACMDSLLNVCACLFNWPTDLTPPS